MPHPAVGRISSGLRPGLSSPDALLRRLLSEGLPGPPGPDLRPCRLHHPPGPRQIDDPQSRPSPDPRGAPDPLLPARSRLAGGDQPSASHAQRPLPRDRARGGQIARAIGGALRALVRGYQLFLSPMLPSACRFHPTCSVYMYEAIDRHGPLRGVALGLKRLAKCHPWHAGGIDHVPDSLTQKTHHGG